MTYAATQSTTRQNGGRHRVLATNRVRCCHRSLMPWPTRPITTSQTNRHGGEDDEARCHTNLGSDYDRATIGDGAPDID
jgi:hypothetical protein